MSGISAVNLLFTFFVWSSTHLFSIHLLAPSVSLQAVMSSDVNVVNTLTGLAFDSYRFRLSAEEGRDPTIRHHILLFVFAESFLLSQALLNFTNLLHVLSRKKINKKTCFMFCVENEIEWFDNCFKKLA